MKIVLEGKKETKKQGNTVRQQPASLDLIFYFIEHRGPEKKIATHATISVRYRKCAFRTL